MSQQQQEKNEAIAHRFHMDIFQEGKLQVSYKWQTKFLLLILFGV
jgi:hypothetical protein